MIFTVAALRNTQKRKRTVEEIWGERNSFPTELLLGPMCGGTPGGEDAAPSWVADGKWGWKSSEAGRPGAKRSKASPGSLKMDVVVNEDYWPGCEGKWKGKYRVEMIPEVEVSAGEKGLWAVILWQALDRGVA